MCPDERKTVLDLDPRDKRLLITCATNLIKWSKCYHSPEYEDSYGEICSFPSNHIVNGANAGGDFLHLDAKQKGTSVIFWCYKVVEI